MNTSSLLGQEWQTLQHNHEQHERNALLIKLVCVVICTAGLCAHVHFGWLGAVIVLLWLQEGIVKTYQKRLSDRLLVVEAHLQASVATSSGLTDGIAMQLHTNWAATRPRGVRLIASYAMSACRPTVAYPYVPMLLVGLIVGRLC